MTLTRQNLDDLPRGTIVRATNLRGLPIAAVKIGDHQTTGAHTWSITGPTIVESFQLAQRDAVLLTEAVATTTPEAEALASLPVYARGGDESVELSTTDATALARQVRRTGTGTARTVQRRAGWLTATHPLADAVRTACTHAEGRVVVGGVGCGQCWEDAIRRDELTRRAVERAGGEAA